MSLCVCVCVVYVCVRVGFFIIFIANTLHYTIILPVFSSYIKVQYSLEKSNFKFN